jgi:hypothetical protein
MLFLPIYVRSVPIGDTSQIRQKQRPPLGRLCEIQSCVLIRLKTDAPENDIFYDESLPLHRVAAAWAIGGVASIK